MTCIKALPFPWTIIAYGEFTTLLFDRTYGNGTSTPTILLKMFGGGKML